jgi:Xaa-Pro aminopeptidase
MPHMDLKRARDIMNKSNIDALIASTEQNFFYSSGYHARLVSCPSIVVVPADSALAPTMIISDFQKRQAHQRSYIKDVRPYASWVCIVEEEDIVKGSATKPSLAPKQFNHDEVLGILSDVLAEKGLQNGKIGIEKNLFMEPYHSSLIKLNPRAKFVDAADVFWEIRRVKTEEEISALRAAAELGEKGILAMIDGGVVGKTIGELHLKYKRGVWQAATSAQAMSLEVVRALISSGDFFSTVAAPEYQVSSGDIIFIDNGVTVFGYNSDMGRTFAVGKLSDLQNKIFSILKAGHDEGLSLIKPGVKIKDVYWKIQNTINKGGLDWHCRGHMGHMIGLDYRELEQPPFISKDEDTILEPNMVLCLEIGTYITGRIGAFQIEDELVVTPGGYELLTKLPKDIIEI